MDWDSTIENEGDSFSLLSENTIVEFEVTDFEKARTKKKDPMAKLSLSLFDGDLFGRCYDNLVLIEAAEWKLCEFFTAIGQRQSGETLKPKWNKVQESKGFAVVGVREYVTDNGRGEKKQANEIKKYLNPEEGQKRYDEQVAKQAENETGTEKPDPDDNLDLG